MKKLLQFVAVLALLALPLAAQNFRVDKDITSISSTTSTPFLVANVPPNSPVLSVCHHPADGSPCHNYITTYDSLGNACPNGAQDTPQPQPSSCQQTGDAQGNIGFWVPPSESDSNGLIDYTVCIANNCLPPQTISITSANSGSGPELQVNGVDNAVQDKLNLIDANAITAQDNGDGSVEFHLIAPGGFGAGCVPALGGTELNTDLSCIPGAAYNGDFGALQSNFITGVGETYRWIGQDGTSNGRIFALNHAGSSISVFWPNLGGTLLTTPTAPLAVDGLGGMSCPTCAVTGAPVAFSAVNNVFYASNQTGADIGARANAAYAACTGAGITNCIVDITPNPSGGAWSYSTDISFSTPTTLRCEPGAILNYTGSGKAAKMGPDGLTISTYQVDPYQVEGCQFTGGGSMAFGIFFNYYVTQAKVLNTYFSNFGNASAWNIWFQGENWDEQVDHVNMWMTSAGGAMNGINQNAGEPSASDNGQSRLRVTNSIIQSLSASGGVGVQLDGANSQVLHTTLAGSFAPLLRLGAWSNKAIISDLNMEVDTSTFCIEFGDASGSRIGNFLGEVTIENNYCNVHNLDFSTTAQFIGPSVSGGTGSGLFNSRVVNNTIIQATPASIFIVLNNKASQTENEAWFNRIDGSFFNTSASVFGTLHTTGGSISTWHGTDELFYTYGPAQINGELTVIGQSGPHIAQLQGNTDASGGLWTSCGLTTRQNCGYFVQDQTLTEIGSLEWASLSGGGRSSWTNNSKAGLQQDQSGNIYNNFSLFGAGAAIFPSFSTIVSNPSAPTVTPTLGSGTTWSYKVTALDASGNTSIASSTGTTTTGAASLDSTHFNTVTWGGIQNAASYKIYRTAVGSSPTTTGVIGAVSAGSPLTLVDNGLAGDSSAAPTVNTTGGIPVPYMQTTTNCSNGASTAVCGSAPTGAVAVPAGVNPTLQINTTAVTASSRIFLTIDESLTIAATTCNTTLATLLQPVVTARSAGVSFTIQIPATLASNPACVSYMILN